MTRLISAVLVCLLCFYSSSNLALAATASSYESIVNQLVYAMTGQLPSAQELTNIEDALLAANAPTDLAGLSAAYSTNAGVSSLIDSLSNLPGVAPPTKLVDEIFRNAFGKQPQMSHPATTVSTGGSSGVSSGGKI